MSLFSVRRKFDGKWYTYEHESGTRGGAERIAKYLREGPYYVRVVPPSKTGRGWFVYTRISRTKSVRLARTRRT